MKPYYQDNHIQLFNKDCRSMSELDNDSVQCVVTSPPYWGLRKYSGEQDLIWGDSDCEHEWGDIKQAIQKEGGLSYGTEPQQGYKNGFRSSERYLGHKADSTEGSHSSLCSLCGAWKGGYGLEPTPEMYIDHTIEILREIRRVLRKDGVVFWNVGDSYTGSGVHSGGSDKQRSNNGAVNTYIPAKGGNNLKPKDPCLIPFRVAIAAQEDGWWVRSDIIWSKPNPMPESVTDRPTNSHEYILMLTKSAKYYWDADAVREGDNHYKTIAKPDSKRFGGDAVVGNKAIREERIIETSGRNIRSVWEFPTQPYPEAHFAVFPEKLPEICIKAATPEVGCCGKCGSPWERIIEVDYKKNRPSAGKDPRSRNEDRLTESREIFGSQGWRGNNLLRQVETIGWQPTCKCNADKVPSVVLDPFAGAGTTLWVAKKLNRRTVGYEISEEYCNLAVERMRQQVML